MNQVSTLAGETLEMARKAGLHIATVESCTGGLIAGALTEVAGSSDVVDRGFITYSNQAKHEMVGVSLATLDEVGAVSAEVALQMAQGGLKVSGCELCVAVTGIAGPGGGSVEKPVGLVYMACVRKDHVAIEECHVFDGDRSEVRRQTVQRALELLKIQVSLL